MRTDPNSESVLVIDHADLDDEIDKLLMQGYKIDMIMPADAPRDVLFSRSGERVRLTSKNRQRSSNVDWTVGRAGMEYRDLIPGRLGGKLIASHIRIVERGAVADSVHYHKIGFQVIYCLKGAIRVVYEDQGPPFWLKPGDCVLQPPEIRHRVLEAEAGSEVVEITSPAEHETWFDHDLQLPNQNINRERRFGTQHFIRYVSDGSDIHRKEAGRITWRETGILNATGGLADVRVLTLSATPTSTDLPMTEDPDVAFEPNFEKIAVASRSDFRRSMNLKPEATIFLFVLCGQISVCAIDRSEQIVETANGIAISANTNFWIENQADVELLCLSISYF